MLSHRGARTFRYVLPLAVVLRTAPQVKITLDHLPPRKQDELRAVTEVLRNGAPLGMLVLFGSYARGDWVEDPLGGYFSDYDLLAIVESRKVAEDAGGPAKFSTSSSDGALTARALRQAPRQASTRRAWISRSICSAARATPRPIAAPARTLRRSASALFSPWRKARNPLARPWYTGPRMAGMLEKGGIAVMGEACPAKTVTPPWRASRPNETRSSSSSFDRVEHAYTHTRAPAKILANVCGSTHGAPVPLPRSEPPPS